MRPGTTGTTGTTGTVRRAAAFVFLLLVQGLPAARGQQSPASAPAPLPAGAISGMVIDGATGSPLSDVIVTIIGGQLPADYRKRQISDARGRFAFINLPDADTYQVVTSKFGHLEGGYGRDGAPTDALRFVIVKNGAWIGNLKVPIWRPSVISGAVRDENGEPLVGIYVRALRRITIAGREDLAAGPLAVTDDRGAYRLSGLLPGRYVIQVPSVQMTVPAGTRIGVSPNNDAFGALDVDDTTRLVIGRYPLPPPRRDGRAMTYAMAFHPAGSSVADATAVDIKFGEERPGIDVALTPMPAVQVSGVVDAPPEALTALTLRLLPAGLESLGLGAETATARVAADGSFTFLNVPPGSYTLDAPFTFNEFVSGGSSSVAGGSSVGFGPSRTLPNPPPSTGWSRSSVAVEGVPGLSLTMSDFRNGEAPNYSGRMPLTVGPANVNGVAVKLYPTQNVRGRFVFENDPAKPDSKPPSFLAVNLDPTTGQSRFGYPRSRPIQGSATEFEIPGVLPGEYWVRASAGDWIVKSVSWKGRDFTLQPIDTASADDLSGIVVTMTNALPRLTGGVRMVDGSVPDSGIVVTFPVSAAQRTNTGFSPARLKWATIQSDGSFSMQGLPAGDYLVAAIDRSRLATWRDPQFLQSLERQASRVSVSWGQTVSQNLTMVGR